MGGWGAHGEWDRGCWPPHPGQLLEGTRRQNYKFTANTVSRCRFRSSSPDGSVWTRITRGPPTPAPRLVVLEGERQGGL